MSIESNFDVTFRFWLVQWINNFKGNRNLRLELHRVKYASGRI